MPRLRARPPCPESLGPGRRSAEVGVTVVRHRAKKSRPADEARWPPRLPYPARDYRSTSWARCIQYTTQRPPCASVPGRRTVTRGLTVNCSSLVWRRDQRSTYVVFANSSAWEQQQWEAKMFSIFAGGGSQGEPWSALGDTARASLVDRRSCAAEKSCMQKKTPRSRRRLRGG